MEGEIRRLKIELDVYNKTILELRKKLEASSKLESEEQISKFQEKIQVLSIYLLERVKREYKHQSENSSALLGNVFY